MKKKGFYSLFSVLFCFLVSSPASTNDNYLVYEDFSSGDMSLTNSDGFKWGGNNRTSIVTMDAEDGAVAIWNNRSIYNAPGDGRNWTAKVGDNSLRFRYPTMTSWAEQRFNLGGAYPEIWIRYWIRVPENFVHNNPSGGSRNDKWFALWMDAYSGSVEGGKVTWNIWANESTGNTRFSYTINAGGHHAHYENFIRSPEDQGRWMQVVLYARASSDNQTEDGETRFWRRWEGESEFELISESTGHLLKIPGNGPEGWAAGYIMGYSNSQYAEDTEWLFDEFVVSTSNLLDYAGPPNPPTGLSAD